jgi:nucleotide-binding universal stress UspA family protein
MRPAFLCPQKRLHRLERIVVGHDLGSGGAAAFDSALVLARRCDALIRLVHVVEPRHRCERGAPGNGHDKVENRVQKSGAELEEIVGRKFDCRSRIEYDVRVGQPFDELILAACAWRADLVVVGGPDREAVHLFGSAAERLARKAPTPVLVTHKRLSSVAKRVMVPIDFSSGARRAAEAGFHFARSFGGQVFLFHALNPTPWYSYPCDEQSFGLMTIPEISPDDVERDWATFLRDLTPGAVPWQRRTEEGRPAETIVKYAEEIGADLIAMGTHGRTGLEYMLLGSVAESVVRRASCPVLVVRPEGLRFALL